jgi:hypothetical protein
MKITWFMPDSFDLTSDGKCAGRGENRGMSDRARVRCLGNSTGLYDETAVTSRYD